MAMTCWPGHSPSLAEHPCRLFRFTAQHMFLEKEAEQRIREEKAEGGERPPRISSKPEVLTLADGPSAAISALSCSRAQELLVLLQL